jgi:hypothetical protein
MAIIKCNECGKDVSDKAKNCPNCGCPIDTKMYCPVCGSSNVEPISTASKVVNTWAWGIFAANKILNNYQCNACKHKWK